MHGSLFAPVKVLVRWISWLALAGLLIPIGILAEVYIGAPSLFVRPGGVSMLAGTAWLALAVTRLRFAPRPRPEATR